jgi:UDP-glucose 4-epimerase
MVDRPSNGQPIHQQHQAAPMSPTGPPSSPPSSSCPTRPPPARSASSACGSLAAAGAVGGHGDRDLDRLIPKALAVARGQAPSMEVNGDGSAVREFTHVADVAQAYLLGLEAVKPDEHQVDNIGTGRGVTVGELLATVQEITGRAVPVRARPAQPEPAALIADTQRARQRLGWRPTRSTLRQIITDAWQARDE